MVPRKRIPRPTLPILSTDARSPGRVKMFPWGRYSPPSRRTDDGFDVAPVFVLSSSPFLLWSHPVKVYFS
jgi:hypothetical protein